MSEYGYTPATAHAQRGNLESSMNKRRVRQEASRRDQNVRGKFIPSFSMRRPVIPTDELCEAMRKIEAELSTTHFKTRDIGKLAMTEFEQMGLVEVLRELGEIPSPKHMRGIVGVVAGSVGEYLEDIPPTIEIGLGDIKPFGSNSNNIGLIPDGWYGMGHVYEEFGRTGNPLPIPILNEETRLAFSSVCDSFEYVPDFKPTFLATTHEVDHHVSVARRSVKNGALTHEAFQHVAGVVEEHIPHEITLGDPVLSMWLKRGCPQVINPREFYAEQIA